MDTIFSAPLPLQALIIGGAFLALAAIPRLLLGGSKRH